MKSVTTVKSNTESEQEISAYLRMPYSRVVTPENDATFRAEIVEFPGCVTTAETASEALSRLEDVAVSWLGAALSRKQRIPNPIESGGAFSGKLMLRLPKTLHRRATYAASREGVSLNQYIVVGLAEQVGAAASRGILTSVANWASQSITATWTTGSSSPSSSGLRALNWRMPDVAGLALPAPSEVEVHHA